jgi:hypothetical protein
MPGILEQIEKSIDRFTPENVTQFSALQIARKLNDIPRLHEYLIAADRYPLAALIGALKSAQLQQEDFFTNLKRIINNAQP